MKVKELKDILKSKFGLTCGHCWEKHEFVSLILSEEFRGYRPAVEGLIANDKFRAKVLADRKKPLAQREAEAREEAEHMEVMAKRDAERPQKRNEAHGEVYRILRAKKNLDACSQCRESPRAHFSGACDQICRIAILGIPGGGSKADQRKEGNRLVRLLHPDPALVAADNEWAKEAYRLLTYARGMVRHGGKNT